MNQNLIPPQNASLLVLIDLQEKLLPAILDAEKVLRSCEFLLDAASLFDVPVLITEQYPRGLGPTSVRLTSKCEDSARPDKLSFSAAELVRHRLSAAGEGISAVVLCGIEAHICVLQTALELLQDGLDVFLVTDATGSRRKHDHQIALARMQQAGIVAVTAESAAFEWCRRADHERFRELSRLVRARDAGDQ
jgi:nicotinamidase-related amidase